MNVFFDHADFTFITMVLDQINVFSYIHIHKNMGYISHHRPVSPYNKLATKSMVMDMRHKCNYKFCKNKAVLW